MQGNNEPVFIFQQCLYHILGIAFQRGYLAANRMNYLRHAEKPVHIIDVVAEAQHCTASAVFISGVGLTVILPGMPVFDIFAHFNIGAQRLAYQTFGNHRLHFYQKRMLAEIVADHDF
ncbi:MAG: hypothetical protein BWX99_02825 [Deltaproteobacteria bacterium ADurb.Bin151]|nr:MAG: hypothetical protein BWX99_02825 [Deltaproteobacteria bacterium ADurb.Bin151]